MDLVQRRRGNCSSSWPVWRRIAVLFDNRVILVNIHAGARQSGRDDG